LYQIVINACVSGIAVGSIYGLVAIGFVVVFNGTRIFNLAQGDLVTVAVMLTFLLIEKVGWPQWGSFLAVLVAVGALSLVEERVIVRPFLNRKDHNIGWFIATLAFALIIETVVTALYGHHPALPVQSGLPTGSIRIGFVHFTPQQLLVVIAFVAVALGLQVFYRVTWLGQAMRATAADRELAMLRGIDVKRISQIAFLIAGLAAAVGGYVAAPIVYADPTIGLSYAIKGFIALAIGGFGSMRGAIVGAIGLGVAEQIFDIYADPSYELAVSVILLIVVLLARPTGLFGSLRAREV
jgi:branched-chain amino acid transport system permease protein